MPTESDVSSMNYLRVLGEEGKCGIDDDGIKGLMLNYLYADGNPKISQKIEKIIVWKVH